MNDRIQLLGVDVDIASTKLASDQSIEYMQDECSKTIYFVNSETLLILQNDSEKSEMFSVCDMVLPGTLSVNDSIDNALGSKRDPFFLDSYFDRIFNYAVESGGEIQLITGNEEQLSSIQENIHEKWSYLGFTGVIYDEAKNSLEHIVNEINSVAPDVLILALDENTQLMFLQDYIKQMNAGLILFTGNILYNKAVTEATVPDPIEKLRIQNIYKWFRRGGNGRSIFNNIKMRLKLKRDNDE